MRFAVLACVFMVSGSAVAERLTLSHVYDLAVQNDPALRIEEAIRQGAEASEDAAVASRWLTASAALSRAATDSALSNDAFLTDSASVTPQYAGIRSIDFSGNRECASGRPFRRIGLTGLPSNPHCDCRECLLHGAFCGT